MYWFATYTAAALIPTYAESLRAGPVMIGMIGGVYGLTQTLLRLPIGVLSDRLNRRKVFIVGAALCAMAAAAVAVVFPSPGALLANRALCGVHSAVWVPFAVLYARTFPPGESGRAMARLTSYGSLGQLAGMLLGGAVGEAWGYPASFAAAIAGGLVLLAQLAFLRDIPSRPGDAAVLQDNNAADMPARGAVLPPPLGSLLTRRIWVLTVTSIVFFYVKFGTAFTFTPILAQNLGAGKFQLGLLNTLYCLAGIAGSALSHTLTARFGERRTLCLALFFMALFSCFLIPFVPSLPLLFAAMALAGFFTIFLEAQVMGLVLVGVAEGRRSTVMGFYQAVYGLGIFLGPVASGAVVDRAGLPAAFYTAGLLSLACVGLVRVGLRADRPAAR